MGLPLTSQGCSGLTQKAVCHSSAHSGGCLGGATGGKTGCDDGEDTEPGAVEVELAGPGVPLSGEGGAGVVKKMSQPSPL